MLAPALHFVFGMSNVHFGPRTQATALDAPITGPVYVVLDARTLRPIDALDPRGVGGVARVPVNPAEIEWYRAMADQAGLPPRHAGSAGRSLAREIASAPLRPAGSGVPFLDPPSRGLAQDLLATFLTLHGLPPEYAAQAAQFFAEVIGCEAFYEPLWARYGMTGPVEIEELVQLSEGHTRMPHDVAQRRIAAETLLRQPQRPRAQIAASSDPIVQPPALGERDGLRRFDVPPARSAPARRRAEAGTALIQHRIQAEAPPAVRAPVEAAPEPPRVSPQSARQLVAELEDSLTADWLSGDFNVSESNVHDVLDRLSRLDDASLAEVVEHLGPELLPRLENWSSVPDRITYADTLARVREVRNRPRATVSDVAETRAEITSQLSYGVFDWEISDGNARNVIDRLSRLPEAEILKLADQLEPQILHRLLDNLEATDRATYAPTIRRIESVMNTPRGALGSEAVAKDVEWYMSYGIADFEISEDEARTSVAQLATLDPARLEAAVRRIHPDYLDRLEPELSRDDRRLYGSTLARIRDARAHVGR